jgi:NAD(P)-dependent dehydrogenase (short-subunit alcohol dehydrogenase family)
MPSIIVTGAASGIGRVTALRLARHGVDVLAVDRDAAGVDALRSEHAVIGLTRSAASELAREGLRINCICPGPTDTPMMAEHERCGAAIPIDGGHLAM